jgi:4'-phosphopantetheinyl transferase
VRHNDAVPLTLGPGEVHAYFRVTDALDDRAVAEAIAVLSPEEQTRASRFVFARDRRDYTAAHALLRTSLSRYAAVAPRSWTFGEDSGGKPFVVAEPGAPPLTFNLSHTQGLVACAIAAGAPVGVDVESIERTVDERVARRFFSTEETSALVHCRPAARRTSRFFDLWTLKEAYIKAIGQGLSHPLNTIVFAIGDDGAITFLPPPEVDAASWSFRLFAPTAHHRLAVAVATTSDAPTSIALMER